MNTSPYNKKNNGKKPLKNTNFEVKISQSSYWTISKK